jgi:hypothetical protein
VPHSSEVLADLVARLRREAAPADMWSGKAPTFSNWVHELPREDVARAVNDGILEVDRRGWVQALANGRADLVPSGDAG